MKQAFNPPVSKDSVGRTSCDDDGGQWALLLRGGRLTKVAGEVASYAPSVGRASPSALAGAAAIVLGAGFGGAALTGLTASQAQAACNDIGTGILCTGTTTELSTDGEIVLGTDASFSGGDSSGTAIDMTSFNSSVQTLTQSGTGQITGGHYGIRHFASNPGASPGRYGGVNIHVRGTVTGTTRDGIRIQKGQYGTATTITAASVVGGRHGINLNIDANESRRWTNVAWTGTVTGQGGDGFRFSQSDASGRSGITIAAASAAGTQNGMYFRTGNTRTGANNRYVGSISMTVSGRVTGGAQGAALKARLLNDRVFKITLNSGAVVGTGGERYAVQTSAGGRLNLTVNSGATISGAIVVSTSRANDTMTFNSRSRGTLSTVRGVDTLTMNSGATVSVGGSATSINKVEVKSGAALTLPGGSVIGSFTVGGGNFTGGGTVTLAADFSGATPNAQKLYVNGDVTGTTTINVSPTGSGATGEFLVVDVSGTVASGNFVAGEGYSLRYDATNKAFYATKVAATGECTETSTGSGVWTCTGGHTETIVATTTSNNIAMTLTDTVAVTIPATATSGSGVAIDLDSDSGAITLTQSATGQAITGNEEGVKAVADANSVSINVNGAVTGRTKAGIYAKGSSATGVTITAGQVSGGASGIHVVEGSTGAINVTATGMVTSSGSGTEDAGVRVAKTNTAGDIDISVATVTASGRGIHGSGGGNVRISATGAIDSGTKTGIHAFSSHDNTQRAKTTTGITITAGQVSGGESGIHAHGSKNAAVKITATGAVTATGNAAQGHAGVRVQTGGNGRDGQITVNVATVTSSGHGIFVRGAEDINITATSSVTVTGTGTGNSAGTGIHAEHADVGAYGDGMDITVGTTSGGVFTGAAVIGRRHGIVANAKPGSFRTWLNVKTGPVTGLAGHGIEARSSFGPIGINVYGDVLGSGTNSDGIRATQAFAENVNVNVRGGVTGGRHGVFARIERATGGNHNITVSGAVRGGSGSGNAAFKIEVAGGGGDGATINLNSGASASAANALIATGVGTTTFNVGAGVPVSGTLTFGTAGNLNLASSATVSGNVTIGDGTATVELGSGASITGNVTLGAGANTLSLGSGTLITGSVAGGAGDDTFDLASATISGAISLGAGTNMLTLSTGAFTGAVTGGTGADTVSATGATISGAVNLGGGNDSVTFENGGTLTGAVTLGAGIDRVTFESGGTLSGNVDLGAGNDTVTFESGGTLSGSLNFGDGDGDTLSFTGGTATLSGAITNVEAVTVSAGATADFTDGATRQFTFSGDFTGGGTIKIDANFVSGASDKFTVTGDVTGTTTIDVSNIGGRATSSITVFTVAGSAAEGNFALANPNHYNMTFSAADKKLYLNAIAVGECTEDSTGVFTCDGGPLTTQQSFSASGTTAPNLNVSVTVTDAVTATIPANAAAGSGTAFDLESLHGTVTLTQSATGGVITGQEFGIDASGDEGVMIEVLGTVTGRTESGIRAVSNAVNAVPARGVVINAAAVTGAKSGIEVQNTSAAFVSVTTTGTVTSTGDAGTNNQAGIRVSSQGEAFHNILVNAATVTSSAHGIWVKGRNYATISASGAVTVTGTGTGDSAGTGIYASIDDGGYASKIDIVAGTGTGSSFAGATVAGRKHGIYAKLSSGSGESNDITVSAGTVTALAGHGIYAGNASYEGTVSIVTTGSVSGSGATFDGISAKSFKSSLSITAGTGTGNSFAGAAVSGGRHGIYAKNASEKTQDRALTVSAGTVTGATGHGVYAQNESKGSISIRTTGSVSGTGAAKDGIYANITSSRTGPHQFTITAASAAGGRHGIHVKTSAATGAATVTISGAVTGSSGAAIKFVGGVGGTVTLQSGATVGSANRMAIEFDADQHSDPNTAGNQLTIASGAAVQGSVTAGTGADTITVSGQITGGSVNLGDGADTMTFKSGSRGTLSVLAGVDTLTIESGATVSIGGSATSINAVTLNSGATLNLAEGGVIGSMTVGTGNFTGGGTITVGVDFSGSEEPNADKLYINGAATGVTTINVSRTGSGATGRFLVVQLPSDSTVSSGTFVQGSGYEIEFDSSEKAFYLEVPPNTDSCEEETAGSGMFRCIGSVTGENSLSAAGTTTAAVTVAAGASLSNASGTALQISQTGGTGGVTLVTQPTSSITGSDGGAGKRSGIDVSNSGGGTVSIDSKGTVTGTTASGGYGIRVRNTGGQNIGELVTTISAAGSVTGHIGIGAFATSQDRIDPVSVSITTTGTVHGEAGAIKATKAGQASGTVSIEVQNGLVSAGTGAGVYASWAGTRAGTVSITVGSAATVSGQDGIVVQEGSSNADVYIDVQGSVTGSAGDGIRVKNTVVGKEVRISVSGRVSGGTGTDDAAIELDTTLLITPHPNRVITLNSGAQIGAAEGLAIKDKNSWPTQVVVNTGASVIGKIDLGGGGDQLTVAGGTISGALDAGTGDDTLTVSGGSIRGTLSGWETVTVESGGQATILGAATVGTLTVKGTLSLNDSATGTLTVSDDFTGGGAITLDATFANNSWSADKVVINGDVTETTTINFVRNVATGFFDEIEVIEVDGDVASGSFVPGPGYVLRFANKRFYATTVASCSETSSSGVYTCLGSIVSPQVIESSSNSLNVNLPSGVTVNIPSTVTAPGHGLKINTTGNDNNITLTQAGTVGFIRGSGAGLYAVAQSGNVSITTEGTVTGHGDHGIHAESRDQEGFVTVKASGTVTGSGTGKDGIYARLAHASGGSLVQIAAADVEGAKHGINLDIISGGSSEITVSGSVSGGTDYGIYADTSDKDDENHSLTLESGAHVSGGKLAIKIEGETVLQATNATISGGISLGDDGRAKSARVALKDTEVSGGTTTDALKTGSGTDTVSIQGGSITGSVTLGPDADTLTIGDVAVTGNVALGDGNDRVILNGARITGNLDLGGGADRITFGPGYSKVMGNVDGEDTGHDQRILIESGAVVHFANGTTTSSGGFVEIKPGAIAILDNLGLRARNIYQLDIEGTLNTADGTSGNNDSSTPLTGTNIVLRLSTNAEMPGSWILDVNFANGVADGLGNTSVSPSYSGPLTIEPAIIAGQQGGASHIELSNLDRADVGAPSAFSVYRQGFYFYVRQDMANGACTSAGSGVYTCADLIWEEQTLSATDEALDVTLNKVGVVHNLAGTLKGLTLSQAGDGGITLTQSAAGGRIAAAGHAIQARNEGAGGVSIIVTGEVIGGMTGRVVEADGITALDSADGEGVYISAAAVSGIRHGIVATAAGSGGARVKTTGDVTGKFGNAIVIDGGSGGASAQIGGAVSGAKQGIRASGGGAVSISVAGKISLTSSDEGREFVVVLNSASSVAAAVSLESGASISGGGVIFRNDAGAANFTVKAGASVNGTGTFEFGGGDDALIVHGSVDASGTQHDFGAGTDTLTVKSGGDVKIGGLAGLENVAVEAGGALSLPASFTVPALEVGGTLDIADGATSVNTVSGNFVGGGVIMLDANFSTQASDTLSIGGNLSGATKIQVRESGAVNTSNAIEFLTVTGNIAANATVTSSDIFTSVDRVPGAKRFRVSIPTLGSCSQNGGSGPYTCSGVLRTQQTMSAATNLTVMMNSAAGLRLWAVTAQNASAGFHLSTTGGNLTFTQSANGGEITGNSFGIRASNDSTTSNQDVSVTTTGKVAGRSGTGISVERSSPGGATIVNASGTVSGGSGDGIFAYANAGADNGGLIQISAVDVEGTRHGIYTKQAGSGSRGGVSITILGSVSGGTGAGIRLSGGGSLVTSSITLADGARVSGSSAAIHVASGTVVLEAENAALKGDVMVAGEGADTFSFVDTSIDGDVDLGGGADTLTVNSGATITGSVDLGAGADTLNISGGRITGTVSGGTGAGNVADVNVSGNGSVGGLSGIQNLSIASGATLALPGSSTLTGNITLNGTLDLSNDNAFSTISAASGTTEVGANAVVVLDANFASGTLKADLLSKINLGTQTLAVDVNVIEEYIGNKVKIIELNNSTTIPTVTFTGANAGSFSQAQEGNFIVVTQTSALTGCEEDGTNPGTFQCNSGFTSSQRMSVTGSTDLVVTIASNASIVTTRGTAAQLSSQAGISVTQSGDGEIKGASGGIHAVNSSGGAISINVTGSVTATADDSKAIYAKNAGAGTGDLTITAGDVSGAGIGIEALNEGTGAIAVAVSGIVAGSAASIKTRSQTGKAVTVTLNSGAVASGGIIDEAGSATVTVNTGASMFGTTNLGAGDDRVEVVGGAVSGTLNLGAGADALVVTSGSASGSVDLWTGDDQVDVTGRFVSGTLAAGDGADTLIVRSGGSVGGSAAAVSASGWETITVESGGAATLSMAAGTATATQLNVAGTLDVADGAHTTLDISGGFTGGGVLVIDVNFADGSGDKIDVAGDITGVTRIQVKSSGGISLASYAFAVAAGTSELGRFAAQSGYILDYDSATKTHTIATRLLEPCTETGSGSGVFVCSGDDSGRKIRTLSLSASGSAALSVTLNSETGIDAIGSAFVLTQTGGAGGIALTQSAGGKTIKGTESGIIARNSGGGAIAIDVNGAVTGAGGDGILATNDTSGTDVMITAASVAGAATGIKVDTAGAGDVSVSATGVVAGASGDGISVEHGGGGATSIAVSSAVTGGSATTVAAIRTDVSSGSDVTVMLGSGASVGEGAANAILGAAGDTAVTVNAGAAIAGKIQLGAGSDALTFAGGAFSAVTEMDGGAGTGDTLTFSAGTGSLHQTVVSEGLKGWESVIVESGATLSGNIKLADDSRNLTLDGATLGSATMLDGGGGSANALTLRNMSGSVNQANLTGWETFGIGAGSSLAFGTGTHTIEVDTLRVSAGGTLDAGDDSDTSDSLTISGAFEGGGAIALNVNFAPGSIANDTLTITGDVTGVTTLRIGRIAETGSIAVNQRVLEIPGVITVAGNVDANAFVVGGEVIFGAIGYRMKFNRGTGGAASTFDLERYYTNDCEAVPGSPGAFTCSGANQIGAAQSLSASGATALAVTLSAQTKVDTNATALTLTQSGGSGGIAFTQARGGEEISGVESGIVAVNTGGGAISLRVNGSVTGANGDGIRATSDASGAGISIVAAAVSGRTAGIRVNASGTSGVSISASGSVAGTDGDGIVVTHGGRGATSIAVSGEVTGGGAAGSAAIRTVGDGGSAAIMLASGASVRAAGGGAAIMDGGAAATVTVQTGAAIEGRVSLGAGADELILAGGDFSKITTIDGGSGDDTLRITAGSGAFAPLSDGTGARNVERVVVSGSAMLEGDVRIGAETSELVFADGAKIDGAGRLVGVTNARLALRNVNGRLDISRLSNWNTLEIGAGSRVELDAAALGRNAAGRLAVTGTMAIGSSTQPGGTLTVEGDFSGGGKVEIDADFSKASSDRLVVGGDASGTTAVVISDRTPQGARPSGGDVEVATVRGEAEATAFRLEGDTVPFGAFTYDLLMEGGAFVLRPGGRVSDSGAALRSAPAAIVSGFARATALSTRTAARAPAAAVGSGIGLAQTWSERGGAIIGQDAAGLAMVEPRTVWARFYSDKREFGADAVSGAAEIDSSGMQFGMDLISSEAQAGNWVAGLTAQYGSVNAESSGGGGVGKLESSGYGVGATLSWFGFSGFYTDVQAQIGMVDSDYSSNTMGVIKSGVSSETSLAALEAGWRMAMGERATLVPQGQISMSSVNSDGFVSGDIDVRPAITTGIEGRIGLAAEYALSRGGFRVSGSLYRTLSEPDGVIVNNKIIEQGLPDGWMEFGIGGSLDVSDDAVIFFDGTWSTGDGRDEASGASFSGGFKLNW